MNTEQKFLKPALIAAALTLVAGCAGPNGYVVFRPPAVVVSAPVVAPPPVVVAPPVWGDYQLRTLHQAERGNAVAQLVVGGWYATGRGAPRDYFEAARWFRRAAGQGYAPAENRLGLAYQLGQGVPRNFAEAAAWYRRAALQGYPSAEYNLARCYQYGRGVPHSHNEAIAWFQKAAAQGNRASQASLNLMIGQPAVSVAVAQNGGSAPVAQNGAPATGASASEGQNAGAGDAGDAAASQAPLTLDEIKMLTSTGIKPDALIEQIKDTHARFSSQDIADAQQASPPVDPTVIQCMKDNPK